MRSNPPPPRRVERRLQPSVFALPVDAIRAGHFTDKYFVHTRAVLQAERVRANVTMQVFQKKASLLSGMDEAIAILKTGLTDGFTWTDLEVSALYDGDRVSPWETVMLIRGPFAAFAHLETLYLGVLGRRTRIATATREVVEAAWPRLVLYFPARHDHWAMQSGDGYAAWIAGAAAVSTEAQGALWKGQGMGTIPHALIAAFGGDTVAAALAFVRHVPADLQVICLVDFENDSVRTAVEVAEALEGRLWGVRLDTSETLVDRSVIAQMGNFTPTGVNPQLVRNVRAGLDAAGFREVRIVVSGGFTADKILAFEAEQVPVDSYGVGSSLLRGSNDFTADVVLLDGQPVAKTGRGFRANPRLEPVE